MADTSETRWPTHRGAALDWLVGEAVTIPLVDDLLPGLGQRLAAEGVPLDRLTLHLRILHPQFWGARLFWQPGMARAEVRLIEHGMADDPRFQNSPVRALYEGAEGIRQRLDIERPNEEGFSIFPELRAAGITDYVALPLGMTDGRRHASSWATRRPGGFSTEDLVRINDLLPVLAMAVEIRANRRLTKNLLGIYVGQHAGREILAGRITRGSGLTVSAAIWNCDLRGFTAISELWPRDDVIRLLNEYFDTMAKPVEEHGGEILKFIGDAMLAIFPLDEPDACRRALEAAREARSGMAELNRLRIERGQQSLGFGLALHVGDVMYGNIGSRTRLDFTVIGPAVNVASRLESLTKELRREVLVSGAFARLCPVAGDSLVRLGAYPLRGVGEPVEVFSLPEEA